MGMFAGALSGSDLVNSVKMRLKSLSGLTADEKRIKMRAMAEELQKVWGPRVFSCSGYWNCKRQWTADTYYDRRSS